MMEFEFLVDRIEHPGMQPSQRGEEPTDLERWVIQRIATMVVGTSEFHRQGGSYRWMLGPSNSWWMDRNPSTGAFTLAYRYGGGANTQRMERLRDTILWVFGVEDQNRLSEALHTTTE